MSKITVLLVDDHEGFINAALSHLRKVEWLDIVGRASNGLEALEICEREKVDIVIMDIFLPGIDGYQALRRIRQTALAPECRFVATTAYYTNDTEQEIAKRGFDGYIPKPFDSSRLIAYLESIVDRPHSS